MAPKQQQHQPQESPSTVPTKKVVESLPTADLEDVSESNHVDGAVMVVQDNHHHKSISSSQPLYMRWSRIQKTVTIRESNSGLLRGSIAAPTASSQASFHKRDGPVQKIILNQVSGCAAPGEVLAMMGYVYCILKY
jgi:hypothetical protein